MPLTTLLLCALGVAYLLFEGVSCLRSRGRPLSIGFLNLLVAVMIGGAVLALYSGPLVFATELGAILAQGRWPVLFLRLALVVAAVAPAICWNRIRQLNGTRSYFWASVWVGLGFGIWAAARVAALNPQDAEPLRVYFYDVWWPPLTLWLSLCFAGAVLDLLQNTVTPVSLAFAASLITPLASFALAFEDLPDAWSHPTWTFLERAGFAVGLFLDAYVLDAYVLADYRQESGRPSWRRALLYLPVAAAAAAFVLLPMPARLRAALGVVPLLPFVVWVVFGLVEEINRQAPSAGKTGEIPLAASPGKFRRLRSILPIPQLGRTATSLALPLFPLLVMDLVSVGWLELNFEIVLIFLFWLLFVERLATGALDALPLLLPEDGAQTLAEKGWERFKRAAGLCERIAARAHKLLAPESRLGLAVRIILLPLAVLFLLIAVDEMFHYRGVVIEPLRWNGPGKADSPEDVSKQISDGLANALGRLREELRTDLVLAQRKSNGEHPASLRLFEGAADSNRLEAALGKSDEIEISKVRIPVTFFLGPIQQFVRSAFGIRTVSGSVQKVGEDYVVWATASDGETWEERTPPAPPPPLQEPCPLAAQLEQPAGPGIHALVERLAFHVASSDPSFRAAGMTRNWGAFGYFRAGRRHWNLAEERGDAAELEAAIPCFRQAVKTDRGFALAYYRLGVAMQRSGRPGSAISAFRDSGAAQAGFVPAAMMEAQTLYNFNSYYPKVPAVLPPLPPNQERRNAALRLWATLSDLPGTSLALSERRNAYYNLCGLYLDSDTAPDPRGTATYLAYFFCRRAEALYFRLPAAERESTEVKALEAAVLNSLGVALDRHKQMALPLRPLQFPESRSCLPDAVQSGHDAVRSAQLKADGSVSQLLLWGSRRTRAALGYYLRSLEILPADTTVRCNAANAVAYLSHGADMGPMRQTLSDTRARLTVAAQFAERGRVAAYAGYPELAAGYYQRALAEYDSALSLDPTLAAAMIAYAGTFWQWQLDTLAHGVPEAPEAQVETQAFRAEKYAREAVRLALVLDQPDAAAHQALGEVLLAQGRMEEAVAELAKAAKDERWAGFDEVLWDTAQARICASQSPQADRPALLRDALNRFQKIRDHEEGLELPALSGDPEALDFAHRGVTCPKPPDQRPTTGGTPRYRVREVRPEAGPSCDWTWVVGEVYDGDAFVAGLFLHVWGDGVEDRIELSREKRLAIELRPGRKGYYFARLEEPNGRAVSAVQAFDTAPSSDSDCPHNQIRIVFAAVR